MKFFYRCTKRSTVNMNDWRTLDKFDFNFYCFKIGTISDDFLFLKEDSFHNGQGQARALYLYSYVNLEARTITVDSNESPPAVRLKL